MCTVASVFRKLRDVLQQRVIRFLLDQSKKEPEKYNTFFEDYGLFMREGIVTTQEQDVKVTSRVPENLLQMPYAIWDTVALLLDPSLSLCTGGYC